MTIPDLPRPSRHAAARMQPSIGDVAIYASQAYLVTSILEMSKPLRKGGVVGLHYVLRRSNWIDSLYLIVPAHLIEQPSELAA